MACTLHPDFATRPMFPEDRRRIAKVMPHSMRWAAGTNRSGPGYKERLDEILAFFESDEAHGHWAQYFRQGEEGTIHFDDADTAFLCKLRFG